MELAPRRLEQFIEELELSRDDLPEHWRKTHHLDEEGEEGAEPVQ